jgi:hypothetical protein
LADELVDKTGECLVSEPVRWAINDVAASPVATCDVSLVRQPAVYRSNGIWVNSERRTKFPHWCHAGAGRQTATVYLICQLPKYLSANMQAGIALDKRIDPPVSRGHCPR